MAEGWGSAIAQIFKLINTLLGRRNARVDDPENKQAKYEEKIDREMRTDDEAGANARLADDLARLRMRRQRMREQSESGGDSGGPGSEAGESGR